MESWGTILLGYGAVLGGVAVYAVLLLRRASVLASRLGIGDDRSGGATESPRPDAGADDV